MNNFDWSQFPDEEESYTSEQPIQQPQQPEQITQDNQNNILNEFPDEEEKNEETESEPFWKSATRKALQIPAGLAQAFTWPLDIAFAYGVGDALSSVDELEEQSYKLGFPFDKEKYLESLGAAAELYPFTQSKAEEFIEEKTGLPLVPKDRIDSLLRLGSMASAFAKGGLSKASAAIAAPTVSSSAEFAGAPEEIADITGLAASSLPKLGAKAVKHLYEAPQKKAQELVHKAIGGEAPQSSYKTSRQLLKHFELPDRLNPQKPITVKNIIEKDYSSKTAKDVGDVLSKEQFYNEVEGGKKIINEVSKLDEAAYKGVNELYKISRAENSAIDTFHPDLYENLQNRLNLIKKIPAPSTPQKKAKQVIKDISKSLVQKEKGEVTGFKDVNNQTLIDQVQALRYELDYDFSHGNAKNILKPIINDLETAIEDAAKLSGNDVAYTSLQRAKQGYRDWGQTFDNDYIRPLRDRSNKDFSKTVKKFTDVDEFNILKSVLDNSKDGKQINKILQRNILEKKLNKYIKDPAVAKGYEFDQAMRELEGIGITKPELLEIQGALEKNVRTKRPEKITKLEKSLSKYGDKKPEDIQNMMNSRTGIKELKQESSKTETGKKLFETIKRQKIRSILKSGEIEKKFTGNKLYEILNNEKNAEILGELLGDTEVEAMRKIAADIGKKQITIDTAESFGKKLAGGKTLLYLLGIGF